MMRTGFSFLLVVLAGALSAQDFEFGQVSVHDLSVDQYALDTTADAVVLREFGEGFIENGDDYSLIFKYHVRIRILKKAGLHRANIEIPLHTQDNRSEWLVSVRASSFNLEDGQIVETEVPAREVYTEQRNKYLSVKKFAIPNVRTGSVLEFTYTLSSPFIFNFRTWEFQSDIPKMESIFWASLPGVYRYNIALRGFLQLDTNESSIVSGCLGHTRDPLTPGFSADCALMKFGMKDIPAFVEEDYMTAKKNFLSAIHFELMEIRHPNGRIDRVTKEWKDAEQELGQDSRFGTQLRRGRELGQEIQQAIADETDSLARAVTVYDYIRDAFLWNGTYGKYSEFGIKKAFDEKRGNVGDINLALVAAMRFAGLEADPVILSTRENGWVPELYPVLSSFNYVVARVRVGGKYYLADATGKQYPFGMLPERCLNGKGRVMGADGSYWIDLQPAEQRKTTSVLNLALDDGDVIRGTAHTSFFGYDAVNQRERILQFPTREDYVREVRNGFGGVHISRCELQGIDEPGGPFVREMDVEISLADDARSSYLMFNPFFLGRMTRNPFRSEKRLYPVDFGVPLERIIIVNLRLPSDHEVVDLPEPVALALPGSGGRLLMQAGVVNGRLTVRYVLSIRKPIYSAAEYHYLKELFNRVLALHDTELVLRKKQE